MSFRAWEEHADSVNKKTSYDECPWHLVPLTCNHFAKILLVKKSIKINKSTDLLIFTVGIQIAHYSNIKN